MDRDTLLFAISLVHMPHSYLAVAELAAGIKRFSHGRSHE
jgi:hypothetical protein